MNASGHNGVDFWWTLHLTCWKRDQWNDGVRGLWARCRFPCHGRSHGRLGVFGVMDEQLRNQC